MFIPLLSIRHNYQYVDMELLSMLLINAYMDYYKYEIHCSALFNTSQSSIKQTILLVHSLTGSEQRINGSMYTWLLLLICSLRKETSKIQLTILCVKDNSIFTEWMPLQSAFWLDCSTLTDELKRFPKTCRAINSMFYCVVKKGTEVQSLPTHDHTTRERDVL